MYHLPDADANGKWRWIACDLQAGRHCVFSKPSWEKDTPPNITKPLSLRNLTNGRTHVSRSPKKWVSNSSSNLPRGPLVRSYWIFHGIRASITADIDFLWFPYPTLARLHRHWRGMTFWPIAAATWYRCHWMVGWLGWLVWGLSRKSPRYSLLSACGSDWWYKYIYIHMRWFRISRWFLVKFFCCFGVWVLRSCKEGTE